MSQYMGVEVAVFCRHFNPSNIPLLFFFNVSRSGRCVYFYFCRFEEMERATTSIGKEKEDVSDIVAEENRKRKRKLEKKEKEKAAEKGKRYKDSFKF